MLKSPFTSIYVKSLLGWSAAVSAVFIAPAALAQGYSTTFNDYDGGFTLSGSGSTVFNEGGILWDTNDPRTVDPAAPTPANPGVGQSDYVGTVNGYSNGLSDNKGVLGGIYEPNSIFPGSNTVYLYRPFDISTAAGGSGALVFDVDFSVTTSTLNATRDTFGWTLQNSAGMNLLSVQFVHNNSDATKYNIVLTSNSTNTTNLAIVQDTRYHMTLNVEANSLATLVLTGANTTTPIFTNVNVFNSNVSPSSVTRASATWILANTADGANGAKTGAGGNALLFDNYSVAPEPSTVALGLAGAAGLIGMARRRSRMCK